MTELANLKPRLMVLETITALPDQPVNRAAIAETATEALRLIESQAAEIARLTAERDNLSDKLELGRAITDGAHMRARSAEKQLADMRERNTVLEAANEGLGPRLETAEAEVARLREALEPFGRVTELPARHAVPDDHYFAGTWLTWGDIRRAREVMGIGKP